MAFQFGMDIDGYNTVPEVIDISSDDEMEMGSWSSDEEYVEDEETIQMAFCVEKALETAGTTGGRVLAVDIPYKQNSTAHPQYDMPSTSAAMTTEGKFPTQYFNIDYGRGPQERSYNQRNSHPIELCKNLIPQRDTPLSPPYADKIIPSENFTSVATDGSSSGNSLDEVLSHFKKMDVKETAPSAFSDCLICGKSTEQIQDEAVIDFLLKNPISGETPEHWNARRVAFLAGMKVGTFMLVPGGVSQAAACDGNLYSVTLSGSDGRALPGTIHLK